MVDLLHLTQKLICQLLMVSRMTINRWVKDGCPRNPDGSYPGPAVVAWMVSRIEEKAEAANQQPVVGARWLEAYREERYRMAKLDRLEREGQLISVADQNQGNAARLRELVHGLKAFCDRLPPLLVGCDRDTIALIVEDEIELLMHAFRRHGRYDADSADAILQELGGKTNRQKRKENFNRLFPSLSREGKTDEEKTA
jgi:hypothetical protein